MARAEQTSALRQVSQLLSAGTSLGISDRDLLAQFLDRDGDARDLAFAALIERHGPMVHRVCRTILRDQNAADDAFQATFLVLVRRARSIWVGDSIGPWLYQVAHRVASCSQSTEARRRRHERKAAEAVDLRVHDEGHDDLTPVIQEEIAGLPERYRAPIVLCCVEGLTQQQAAGQLGWPIGTLQSRLARGRERLRGRLVRRGVAPAIALPTPFASMVGVDGGLPAALRAETVRAAIEFSAVRIGSAGTATTAISSLTYGVLKAMLLHDLRVASVAVLAVAVSAAGVGVWARQETGPGLNAVPAQTARAEEPIAGPDYEDLADAGQAEAEPAGDNVAALTYGDGTPDGKRSLGGSGELIQFTGPAAAVKVSGVRIHGSRYGQAQAPRESFLIYFLNEKLTRVLHTEMAPYSVFERGAEGWVAVSFERPIELPKSFWIAIDFRAAQTKGVYVSFDSSTGGKYSRAGLPGMQTAKVTFGGDWMIEATLAK
jgi:RNA polymerase sigma factor (sigma-70 family)